MQTAPHHATPGDRSLSRADGLGSVTFCQCGTLSLNIQSFSVRLDVQSFVELISMCEEAVKRLQGMAENLETTLPTSQHVH